MPSVTLIRRKCLQFPLFTFIAGAMLCLVSLFAASGCIYEVQGSDGPPPAPAPGYQPANAPSDAGTAASVNLDQYGTWVDISTYGQCWRPNSTPPGWQPYTVGHWQYTDDGWCWVPEDDEVVWGAEVYHYGCWDDDPSQGWVWIPGTVYAPAWVAWREGDGYCGWAPLPPELALHHDYARADIDRDVPASRFVYVNEQYVNESRVDQHVVRNDTTIISRTTNITQITNNSGRVINRGVPVANVEHATGHPVAKVAAPRTAPPIAPHSPAARPGTGSPPANRPREEQIPAKPPAQANHPVENNPTPPDAAHRPGANPPAPAPGQPAQNHAPQAHEQPREQPSNGSNPKQPPAAAPEKPERPPKGAPAEPKEQPKEQPKPGSQSPGKAPPQDKGKEQPGDKTPAGQPRGNGNPS